MPESATIRAGYEPDNDAGGDPVIKVSYSELERAVVDELKATFSWTASETVAVLQGPSIALAVWNRVCGLEL